MFNNYKVNLQSHSGLNKFYSTLNQNQQQELLNIINSIESLINNNMEEKERLLDIVNNMQIQTQNNLDLEISKNAQLSKQVNNQTTLIAKQIEEIASLNRVVVKRDTKSLYSSPLHQSNKLINFAQSIPIQNIQQDYYQQLYQQECKRQENLFKIWQKLQFQNKQQIEKLQQALNQYLNDSSQDIIIQQQQNKIIQLEETLTKYNVALKLIINQTNLSKVQDIIFSSKLISSTSNESNIDELIDQLLEFANQVDQIHQLQSKQLNNKEKEIQNSITETKNKYEKLEQDYQIVDKQKQELLQISQQLNEKITIQSSKIEEMNKQISQLTQLFAKALNDLERVQEENELLKKTENLKKSQQFQLLSQFTTRTSEVYSRPSIGIDKFYSQSTKNSKCHKNKSMITNKSQLSEYDELAPLIEQIFNQGFSSSIIKQLAAFGNSGLKKQLKDLLFSIYNNNSEIDSIFTIINQVLNQFKMQELQHIGQISFSKMSDLLDFNNKQCLNLLNLTTPSKESIIQSLSNLSQILLQVSQEESIMNIIDQHIKLSKKLNKKYRNIQFSSCKMIMDIFKKLKQNYISITSALYSISKSLQQNVEISIDDELNRISQNDVGNTVKDELNKLFLVLM